MNVLECTLSPPLSPTHTKPKTNPVFEGKILWQSETFCNQVMLLCCFAAYNLGVVIHNIATACETLTDRVFSAKCHIVECKLPLQAHKVSSQQ